MDCEFGDLDGREACPPSFGREINTEIEKRQRAKQYDSDVEHQGGNGTSNGNGT